MSPFVVIMLSVSVNRTMTSFPRKRRFDCFWRITESTLFVLCLAPFFVYKRDQDIKKQSLFLLRKSKVALRMDKSWEEMKELLLTKFATKRYSAADLPPPIQDTPPMGKEALKEESVVAAVVTIEMSAVAGDPDSHVPLLVSEMVGSGEVADEEMVPTLVPAIEDTMAPLISVTSLGTEQSGEDQLCERSGSPDVLDCAEEADVMIPSIMSPARTCQDGAGKIEEVLSLATEPETADASRASSPLMEERTDLVSVGLVSRSSIPEEGDSSSRKRRRESKFCLPPPLPLPSITTNPSSVPPSSGSFIPELGDLRHFASLLGKHSLSPIERTLMERQGPCMRMKEVLKSLSKVHHYVVDFATHASRNFPLELSCALEKIEQFEDVEKQYKASINVLGRQCDEANAALIESEERVARREAVLQKVEKRLIEKERLCTLFSKSCSRAEDELRHLRDAWRRHQELEHPGHRRGRSTERSSRNEPVHPQRASSSVRSDHQSEERMRAKGRELFDEAIRSAFFAGSEQRARLIRNSGLNAQLSAQDEVLKNISAEFQSRFDTLRLEL